MGNVTGIFKADFQNFFDAVATANVKLKTLDQGAANVGTAMDRMANSLGGGKLIQDANMMVAAIQQIGGATTLTAKEQAKVNATVTEAINKYTALGKVAPQAMVELAHATKQVDTASSAIGTSVASMFTAFSAANLATMVVTKLADAVQDLAAKGAKLPAIEQSFDRLASSIGEDGSKMLSSLQTSTRGMVSNMDLMLSSNKALLLGLPVTAESMGDMAQAATALGKAMGMDATQSLDDLITALGRSSPMILDNLGLTVKVGEANEVYAAKLGKTVEALTDAEKKMAFYDAAMEAARKKTKELGEQTMTLSDLMTVAWTSISNVVTKGAGDINQGIGLILTNWKALATAMENGPGAFGLGMKKAIDDAHAAASAAANDAMVKSGKFAAKGADSGFVKQGDLDSFGKVAGMAMADLDKIQAEFDEHQKKFEEAAKKSAAIAKAAAKEHADAVAKEAATIVASQNAVVKGFIEYNRMNAEMAQTTARSGTELKNFGAIVAVNNANVIAMTQVLGHGIPVTNELTKSIGSVGDEIAQTFSPAQIGKVQKFGEALASTVMGALQGGGDLKKALGGMFGESLFDIGGESTGISNAITRQVAKLPGKLGGALAGVLDSVLPGIGGMLGQMGAQLLGKLFDRNKGRDAVEQFGDSIKGGLNGLRQQLGALQGDGERLWIALTQGTGKNNPEQAKKAIADIEAALKTVPDRMNAMVAAASTAGGGLDAAMVPYIEDLIRAGQLTEENTNLLLGLPAAGVPAFSEVAAAAEALGLNIDTIGESIKQMGFEEAADKIATNLDILQRAGADMDAVLTGTRDQIQKLVNDAMQFGRSLPESIKPFLQQMVESGKLTDLFGDKLTDLDDLHFTKPLEESVDDLIKAMRELVDVITNEVGGALDGLNDHMPSPRVNGSGGGNNTGVNGGSSDSMEFTNNTTVVLDGQVVGNSVARQVIGR